MALHCNCDSLCSHCQSCAVMFVHGSDGGCSWICEGCVGPNPDIPGLVARTLMQDGLIDFEMRNASLGSAAQLLARGAYAEIFVPASRIDERREMRLESVSLESVVRELGLLAVDPAS